MEFAGLALVLVYFAAVAALILWPLWALWLAYRAVRHLYHIEVALFQIRDALRTQPADQPVEGIPHIANSMFGR
jgi:hypothetical protein